ncbi:DUF998 domain-containing protein [Arcanobacterium pinnipediorum]|uniref:DUF998 domain-containing protein n=1 Tax=Arcanobacterium pinnipediorum TaxID=1503041 RepID=A0ABY5AHT9_9ACTO|nr:DUF998 domain-containing protein [Arcanobacterium pinnipediorum]USR78773.1 DUF998 domain-containing protein [Arcanobacterium pinnipediorum]
MWLCIASGFIYASFILEIFFNFPLNPKISYLSEYFAIESPYRLVFATTDLLSALLMLAGLACLSAYYRLWSRWQLVIAIAYSIFAIFTILDVSLPLQCAESLEFCEKTTLTPHLLASAVVSASLIVVAATTLILVAQRKIVGTKRTVMLIVISAYVFLTILIALFEFIQFPIGYAQRAQVFFSCLLIASAGLILYPYGYPLPRSRART